jgi:hypothetical protein
MDAIKYDGVDVHAIWRAHLREVTMARQAAERRLAQRASRAPQDAPARTAAARQRTEEFRLEMDRINADHKRWQREHGVLTTELPDRRSHGTARATPISIQTENASEVAP